MRANVGIRRRLAPLLDNSRPEIELIHALLLSLPGSPCLYYGDEIGMGDNIWLIDRDAVRTPMQWTPDRNAGFSDSDPGKLYLPVISSLVYHYNGVNVEAQMATGHSLLHWVRGMLGVRRLHPAFGLGDFDIVPTDNESILAYTRSMAGTRDHAGETLLCVNNLSDKPQAATVQLPENLGENELFDLFGGANFPWIAADGRVTFTMGSRDFFWLRVGAESRG
jgi:maltose alpha-D-glucosyltransferase/alpha-amylase